jgi:hypothetical protein
MLPPIRRRKRRKTDAKAEAMRKSNFLAMAIASLIGASPSGARAAPASCDVSDAKTFGELNDLLSRRAVEVINRAAARGSEADRRLQQLVSPDAPFSTGGGDVRIVLDPGVAGARALATDMKADSFRFYGWDGIPRWRWNSSIAPKTVPIPSRSPSGRDGSWRPPAGIGR